MKNTPLPGIPDFGLKLLEGSVDGIMAFDRDCRCVFWSPAMERISGIGKRAVIDRRLFEVFPFLKETGEDGRFTDALEGKSAATKNHGFVRPNDGSVPSFETRYSPIHGEGGEVVGGMAVVRDITERVRADHRLQETENRFRVMADCAPVLLWMSRTDALCDFFNQTWLEFTGRTQEQEWGVGWAEGVHPEDFQRCVDTYMAAFRKREAFSMEYRLKRHDGEYRWILDRGVPRYSVERVFMGYIGSCIDITDRKASEEERAKLIVQLGEALKIREEFMVIASHELKTPLTPLKLQLQLLQRHLRKEGLSEILETAEQQLDRLSGLVEDLLDASRVSGGRMTVDKQEMDLMKLARAVVRKFDAQITASKTKVIVSGDPEVKGNWDPFRLEQIVVNLLSNALKYGQGKPVEISVSSDARVAKLAVRDHGIGIVREDQERIFDRFERAVSYKNFGGLGLGLYISRQLAIAHGGTVEVESEPGKGSVFILEIPV